MLPIELLNSLNEQIPCRELQIRQLTTLLNPAFPSPSTLVLHGLEATGKSLVIDAVLKTLDVTCAIVRSQECITARHLLERIVASCRDAIQQDDQNELSKDHEGRCESISGLTVHLQCLLKRKEKFILVLDGIDRQREASPTFLPAIARLGEIASNLTIIAIVTAPRPYFLRATGVPHIHFPPYDRSESLTIASRCPLRIFARSSPGSSPSPAVDTESEEDDAWLWSRFCGAVWDSIGKGAARDIASFRNVCKRLWEPFVQPIRDGIYGTRDFSRLMVRNRSLFQGEGVLTESIVPISATEPKTSAFKHMHDLPYYTAYLLLASYLASYNPSRHDITLFTTAHEKRRRKKGGGTALTPSHRPSKHRKIQRRLLGPQAFILERMLAIYHAILSPHKLVNTVDVMTQIATLASLRLLVRMGGGSADVLDGQTRWRINVGWEFVREVARSVRFDVENYLAE